jgi:hypothetical protein
MTKRNVATIASVGVLLTACVIADSPPPLEPFHGFASAGLVMCGKCWHKPFCFNAATGEYVERPSSNAPCIGEGFVASQVGTRVLTTGDGQTIRTTEFHCEPEGGKNFSPPDVLCPADAAGRAPLQGVNACVDVPRACRDQSRVVYSPCTDKRQPGDGVVQFRRPKTRRRQSSSRARRISQTCTES